MENKKAKSVFRQRPRRATKSSREKVYVYGIRKRWVLFLLLFEGVANRAAETSSRPGPIPLWQQVLGERAAESTAEGIPSRPQN